MQFIKDWLGVGSRSVSLTGSDKASTEQPRIRVGILGTGKIGADLLVKVRRSPWFSCVLFAGRNLDSDGMRYAASLGVPVSDKGINAFYDPCYTCDLVFDATSAACHLEHAQVFEKLGIFAIDMTPSQIGELCVPALGMVDHRRHHNISMISCGGQASTPIAQVLYQQISQVRKIAVKSIVSANSIGPGTLANINEYYCNTRAGLRQYTGDIALDVDLIADAVNLRTPMLTSITASAEHVDLGRLREPLAVMVERVQRYVPGYRLIDEPTLTDDGVRVDLCVEGLGDYLPAYAGNLDIINCAALAVAEDYARYAIRSRQYRPYLPEAAATSLAVHLSR
ncbi:acetylating acetaldehyde dehydrogenase [Cellvibrio japonicus]|uniref:Acetaldehyde dehydrogenase n=1 Tax=Cellvibrio japonicus (strain Ueda107) TaxID=498211 RepID=B3PE24_CELJU|nr:acetylating acetaldehyde dehydrogenase [Cellvibrio japonicus]ACE85146.1 acetaldehyde dehydrogenase [Cellvibrio japonicus Ueda107]QEI12073.1 acetylating acetaldehyde dehydrogenase [Cellvibrio japonicus]QEI15647.1 acetylating acetaldehyde dehydrogenase [Cellvibrio japonicus]QEI19225.1 acetylating acetaldehyde dehydrogenase [Cellvibrio japonicus]